MGSMMQTVASYTTVFSFTAGEGRSN